MTTIPYPHNAAGRLAQRGFSLVELMISLVLGLLIVSGMMTLLARNSETRGEIEKAGRQIENGRYAMQRLSEDLHHAGFYGEFSAPPVATSVPDRNGVCAVPDSTRPSLVVLQTAMSLPVQGFTGVATGAQPSCIDDADFVSGSNVLVVRFASPAAKLAANWAVADLTDATNGLAIGAVYIQPNVEGVTFVRRIASSGFITSDLTDTAGTGFNNFQKIPGPVSGNLWRVNISALTAAGAPDYANWTVNKIAALGGTGSNARKFLFGPDVVAFDGPPATTDSIMIGSGDREQPFDVSVANKFYMVKDSHALNAVTSTATTESVLCDLTSDALQGSDPIAKAASQACLDLGTNRGWYLNLETGEKVVTNSVTVNGTTVFGTNKPESTLDHTNTCSSGVGEARLYSLNFKNATYVIDQATSLLNRTPDGLLRIVDRFAVIPGGGLPPPPTAITTLIGGKPYEGIASGATIVTPPGVPTGRRTRVFWNIRNESN